MKKFSRLMLGWIVLLQLLIFTACDQPELPLHGFAAKATLSRSVMSVGDVISLTLTARHPAGSAIKFPSMEDGLAVRGRSVDTTNLTDEILETEAIYQLSALRVGNWLVTTNSVVCTMADGSEMAQTLPELILHVKSTLSEGNADSLSDIKGPISKLSRVLWVIVLILVIALLAGLATLLILNRSKTTAISEVVIPPHVKAREALAALKEEEWVPEPFFVKLSLVLRTYLEDRFELHAPESTTEELARILDQDSSLSAENRSILQQFFTQADLVKFARADAANDVMHVAFDNVQNFVNQTEPSDESSPNTDSQAS